MISEPAIAAEVATLQSSRGWENSQEVTLEYQLRRRTPIGDGRADLVHTRANLLAVTECKAILSFELFAQAARWLEYAHGVWIAVPYAKRSEGRHEAFEIARRHYGFGIFEIVDGRGAVERQAPRWREHISPELLESLRPEHKTHGVAGSPGGGQWTSFKGTGAALAKYVADHPACTLGEAVEAIEHHYKHKASARSSLEKAIRRGEVPGVHFGWKQRLYSTEEAARRGVQQDLREGEA